MRVIKAKSSTFGIGIRMLERCILNLNIPDPEHV